MVFFFCTECVRDLSCCEIGVSFLYLDLVEVITRTERVPVTQNGPLVVSLHQIYVGRT